MKMKISFVFGAQLFVHLKGTGFKLEKVNKSKSHFKKHPIFADFHFSADKGLKS